MRKVLLALLGVVTTLVAVPVLGFLYVLHRDASDNAAFLTSHPLIQNLPSGRAAARAEMLSRLAGFAVGSDAARLRAYLAGQGFEVRRSKDGSRASYAALTRLGNLNYLARRDWYVSWQENETGHLVSVDAPQFVQIS